MYLLVGGGGGTDLGGWSGGGRPFLVGIVSIGGGGGGGNSNFFGFLFFCLFRIVWSMVWSDYKYKTLLTIKEISNFLGIHKGTAGMSSLC